eukprot:1550120-Lingulodinium_polyedra.AAC.1
MQFQHLKGDPTLPELLVTPREAHGQQGAIERAIQEVKKLIISEDWVPLSAPALVRSAWLRNVEQQLNSRVNFYYDGVAVSPMGLYHGLCPPHVLEGWKHAAHVTFAKLREKDRGWKMLEPQVGQKVLAWKEPSLYGKRGSWSPG